MLLVDDDAYIVEVLRRGLKLKGLLVDADTSPQEALESFKPNIYNIAILDIRMPAITRFQLYREIKRRDPTIAICFLSALKIQPDESNKVFPSMKGDKTVVKKGDINQWTVKGNNPIFADVYTNYRRPRLRYHILAKNSSGNLPDRLPSSTRHHPFAKMVFLQASLIRNCSHQLMRRIA